VRKMSFKSKFPSLCALPKKYAESLDDVQRLMEHDVERCCLDKQKVEEAIETVRSMIVVSAVNHNYVLELIQKELGLWKPK